MSIETLLAASIKATEDLTATLKALPAAIAAGVVVALPVAAVPAETVGKKATAKKTIEPTAADPAATSAAPADAAAGSAPGAGGIEYVVLADAVTAFAKAHGKDIAREVINKFGAEGRASNIKEIDRLKAYETVKAKHAELDAAKAASQKPAESDSLI